MIPLVRPLFPNKDKIWSYFQMSVEAGTYANFGPCHDLAIERIEKMFGKQAVLSNTGTDAIRIAAQVSFRPGSRVAVPDYTHIGTLQAIVAAGHTPILFPVSKDTWTLSVGHLAKHMSEWDAAVVVAPFGYPVSTAVYDNFFHDCSKPCIYDLAGCYGYLPKTDWPVCYSFHATKTFSCGEGGLTLFTETTTNPKTKGRKLTNFNTNLDRSIESIHGYNMKPDELKCAVILSQLDNHELVLSRVRKRQNLIHKYRRLHAMSRQIDMHIPLFEIGAPSLCVLPDLNPDLVKNDFFVAKQYYPLLSKMPGLSCVKRVDESDERYFDRCIALPSDATEEESDRIIEYIEGLK